MFFDKSLIVCLFHIEVLTFSDEWLRKSICHQIFILKKDVEELLSQNREVFLLQKLRIDLTQLIKLWINLILRNRALVTDEVL